AEVVVTMTTAALGRLGKIFGKYYDLIAALDKLGDVIDAPLERRGGEIIPPQPTGLRIDARIDDQDLHIESGTYYGPSEAVDRSGASETAARLVRYLQRLSADSVAISVENIPLDEVCSDTYWNATQVLEPMGLY